MLFLESLLIALFLVAMASGNLYWFYVCLVNALRSILERLRK